MSFLNGIDIFPWLDVYSENVAMGLVIVLIYDLVRPGMRIENRRIEGLAIGLLFGAGAIASMNDPVHLADGLSVDARNIFVLTGSLFGGPIGATLVTAMCGVYRIEIGGPGATVGVATILASGLTGMLFNRRYGGRVIELGIVRLIAIGLVNTTLIAAIVRVFVALRGTQGLPLSAELTGIVIFPFGSAFLGTTLSMTHYRNWGRTQQRLADIVESTSDLVWETDVAGHLTFLSKRFHDIVGIDPTGLLGKTIAEAGVRWIDADIERAASVARQAHLPYSNLLAQVRGHDGLYRTLQLNGRAKFTEFGRFTGYRGTAQDVTERERMHQDLRRSREHLARAQSVGKIGSVEIDIRTGKALWSDALFQLYGIGPSAQPASLEEFLAWVHPDDRAAMRENCERSHRGEAIESIDFRFRRVDGETRWIHLEHGLLRDSNDIPTILIDTHHDVTATKKADDDLRRSETHLARAQSAGRIGSSEINLVGEAHRWSDEYFRLLGFDPSTTIPGRDLFLSVVVPEDRDKFFSMQELARRDGPIPPVEFRIRRPDGIIRWLRRDAELVRDTAGTPISIVFTVQDVTERKDMEEDLRRSHDGLERAQKMGRVGSGEVDLVTGEVVWSEPMYEMMGLDPAGGASTELYMAHIHPDDRDRFREARGANERGEQTGPIDFRFVRPDGTVRWFHREVELERNGQGRMVRLFTTQQDITDRRLLEEELGRHAEHLRHAQHTAHIGSAEADLNTGAEIWSEGMRRIFDVAPGRENLDFTDFLARVYPDDRALIEQLREKNKYGIPTQPAVYRLVRPDGEVRWIRRVVEIILDLAGKPSRLLATHQDITEQMKTEENLRRSSDGMLRAQKMGQIGSSEVNLVTGETVWSEPMYAMMGLDPLGGASVERYLTHVHPDDRAKLRALREANERGESTDSFEFRFIRPDGEERWFHREAEVEWDAAGHPATLYTIQQDITERRLFENALGRSEAHLARAQSAGHIGSTEVDLIRNKEYWSEGYFRLLGLDSAAEAPERDTLMKVLLPEDRGRLLTFEQIKSLTGPIPPAEYRVRRPDGELRWLRRYGEMIRNAAGEPIAITFTAQDITERRQVEDELRRSRDANARSVRALRMLSDCNQMMIHAGDEERLMRDICGTICEAGGYALAWIGRVENGPTKSVTPLTAFAKEGSTPATQYIRDLNVSWDENEVRGRGPMGRSIRSGRIVVERDTEFGSDYAPWRSEALARGYRSSLTIPLRDGERVFAAVGIYSTDADAFDAAEIELMAELGSDLTYGILALRTRAARDKAERELEAAEDELRAIMDNTIDGLITVDENGTVLTFSRPAERIFGYALDEVIGRSLSMLMPLPDEAQHDESLSHHLSTGIPQIVGIGREATGRRKDGSVFPMDLQIEELPRGALGRRFVGTVRDISERKQTESQLMQSQKMEAIGQLTGGVAHDFNNLLGVILGRLEILDRDLASAPLHQASVRSCVRAVERGATLTKSLLAFARQQSLMPIELDLNAVLGDMAEILQHTLGEAYEFRVVKGTDLWMTEADPGQLQNALLNLVLNARDAMPRGGRVTVSMSNERLDSDYALGHEEVRAGDYVALSVSDTGIGMSPEVVAHVFEPFFTTKETGKGSGLGLSMVYGFVKQTGGHVTIYSEPGKGTAVRIYLPRKLGEIKSAAKSKKPVVGGDETILVVEDNEDLRDLTKLQLERLGYTVLAAVDASDALETLTLHPETALLLTDVVLPKNMNGPALAERACALVPALGVIFMSGYNELHVEIENAIPGRPLRLLQKPFHAETLAGQIRSALDSRPDVTIPMVRRANA